MSGVSNLNTSCATIAPTLTLRAICATSQILAHPRAVVARGGRVGDHWQTGSRAKVLSSTLSVRRMRVWNTGTGQCSRSHSSPCRTTSRVVPHGQQHAHFHRTVDTPNAVNLAQQLGHAVDLECARLDRNNDIARCRHRADRRDRKRGRAVDHEIIVGIVLDDRIAQVGEHAQARSRGVPPCTSSGRLRQGRAPQATYPQGSRPVRGRSSAGQYPCSTSPCPQTGRQGSPARPGCGKTWSCLPWWSASISSTRCAYSVARIAARLTAVTACRRRLSG